MLPFSSQMLISRIENLELQIRKGGLELQILEANLRDYELDPEQEPSLHQLSWCERNINHSLERVIARKNALANFSTTSCTQPNFQARNQMLLMPKQDGTLFSPNFIENEQNSPAQNLKHDPWMMSSQSTKVGDNTVQDLFDQTNFGPNMNPGPSNVCNISHSPVILESGNMVTLSNVGNPSFQVPQQQPFLVGQTLLDFPQPNVVNAWNNFSSATYSNAIDVSTQSLAPIQSSRLSPTTIITNNASDVIMPRHETTQNSLQSLSQCNNMEGGEIGHDNYINNLSNNNVDEGDHLRTIGCNKMNTSHQSEGPSTLLNNPQQEDASGDDTLMWTTKVQKTNIWEWDDLLLDENFNWKGFPNN